MSSYTFIFISYDGYAGGTKFCITDSEPSFTDNRSSFLLSSTHRPPFGRTDRPVRVIPLIFLQANIMDTRCEPDAQKLISGLTFEQLVTDPAGVQASRALVNVIINQQIGQQINVGPSVCDIFGLVSDNLARLTQSVKSYSSDAGHSAVRMM